MRCLRDGGGEPLASRRPDGLGGDGWETVVDPLAQQEIPTTAPNGAPEP
jgi:hypothetical protein